jgi:esterase/lipase superfamily enzyme
MERVSLFYATNRKHEGASRWKPDGYGTKFSDDGVENLRFGRVTVSYDGAEARAFMEKSVGPVKGDGEGLGDYLAERAEDAAITAYREEINAKKSDSDQPKAVFGSKAMFTDLQKLMLGGSDALVYIHGFNVSWHEAVGAAASLQLMLNRPLPGSRPLSLILFSWPSDGMALPYVSYKSDRSEAQGSGYAVGRAFLKLRDYLARIRAGSAEQCDRSIHLLCHSMGNYVLQSALDRIRSFTPHSMLPRIFDRVFMCAADVDDGVLEAGAPMGDLHELSKGVSVYFNRGDVAMYVSDYTKGNPERLGTNGPARPSLVHSKVEHVDCTPVVSGLVEHSYYLSGVPVQDIRLSTLGLPVDHPGRRRRATSSDARSWVLS